MTRILVTGASGFVGLHLLRRLAATGHDVRLAGRKAAAHPAFHHVTIDELGPKTDWRAALEGRDAVVHLAAQVPAAGVDEALFRRVNDQGTERLVWQAKEAGVARLVFLSSIFAAVAGEDVVAGEVQASPYGASKRAAEAHVAAFSGPMQIGISLRAPLVYGQGAKGNWAALAKLAALPMPLPFGAVRNRRSVIAVGNLVDAILRAVETPVEEARPGVYPVADEGTVSTADILRWLREGMGRRPGLLPVPVSMMTMPMTALGRGQMAQSLFGDLVVDTRRFTATFGWHAPVTSADAIRSAGAGFGKEGHGDGR